MRLEWQSRAREILSARAGAVPMRQTDPADDAISQATWPAGNNRSQHAADARVRDLFDAFADAGGGPALEIAQTEASA